MNARTYKVSSMQEAMRLIREELGPDASVLHARQIGQPWWKRLLGGPQLEVVAASDVQAPSRLPAVAPPLPSRSRQTAGDPSKSPASDARADARPASAKTTGRRSVEPPIEAPETEPEREQLQDTAPATAAAEISPAAHLAASPTTRSRASAKARAARSVGETPPTGGRSPLRELYAQLRTAELPTAAAKEYVERLRPEADAERQDVRQLKRRLLELLEREFKTTGPLRIAPGRRRVVAIVGPTGVGKTTTIAKLAAIYHLRSRCRVGLITADTFRIAAADQLRTYADIIGVPLEVVATPAEMTRALGRLADRELVLVDSSGHGPRDEIRMGELKAMLAHARPDETHLVLSAAANPSANQAAAKMFSAARPTALLLTKLDEASALGGCWPLLKTWRWPVSYFTGGQNVPDDIEPAAPATLARRMLGLSMGGAHV